MNLRNMFFEEKFYVADLVERLEFYILVAFAGILVLMFYACVGFLVCLSFYKFAWFLAKVFC